MFRSTSTLNSWEIGSMGFKTFCQLFFLNMSHTPEKEFTLNSSLQLPDVIKYPQHVEICASHITSASETVVESQW